MNTLWRARTQTVRALLAGMATLAVVSSNAVVPDVRYTLRQEKGVWSFVSPEGKPFWSFGVCCVGPGTTRTEYNPANRSYASFRLFENDEAWTQDTLRNLRRWGFNCLGGWSEVGLFERYGGAERLPYFVVLHLGQYDNAPWNDMFGPEMAAKMDAAAREQIARVGTDPFLVGYFTDNELGWWGDSLFRHYLGMPKGTKGREVLFDLIERHYAGDFKLLRRDWATTALGFAELRAKPDLRLKPGGAGIKLVKAWVRTLAEQYYRLVRDTVRRYDRSRLILGDRLIQYYSSDVARAAAHYVDAVSTNLGADWNDGTYASYYLETLHKLTGKPIVVTEFYMAAKENRSCNRNSGTAFPVVQTQAERAVAFIKGVESLASLPYVVGAHWFQFTDEPEHGRSDGEDFNMGLVDIEGKPYEEMTRASSSLNLLALRKTAKRPANAMSLPPAPAHPLQGLKGWPRSSGRLEPEAPGFADLFVCWAPDALYLGLYAMDYLDEKLYEGGRVPESERALWLVTVGKRRLSVRFGGNGLPARCDDREASVAESGGLKHTVVVRIPMKLNAGERVRIGSAVLSHSRGEETRWKATLEAKE